MTCGMNDDIIHELYFGLTLYTNYFAARNGMRTIYQIDMADELCNRLKMICCNNRFFLNMIYIYIYIYISNE